MLQLLSLTVWIFIQNFIHDNVSLQKCQDIEYTKRKVDEVIWKDVIWKLIQ